ncbi:GtrA family protein [Sphingomonas sp.]|uniref:GtrA family protein n=1 Tax=Sphingomonas sp. TaxID=28214 RepID=UPI003AFFD993
MTDGRPLRFLIVGGINTAFGLAVYPALLIALRPLGIGYMGALPIAQAVSLVFAYTLQKIWVFRTRGDVPREFARFASFYLGIYAINWLALPFLVEVVRLRPWVAQLGFVGATVIGSWFFHSRLTFGAAPRR